jgi:hypothetical protein
MTEMAQAAAVFANECLHHVHKGVIDCEDKIIVFFNGKWPDLPERVRQFLREAGIEGTIEISQDSSGSNSALVATNYGRHPIDLDRLNALLWEDEPGFYRVAQMTPVMTYQHGTQNSRRSRRS